MRQAGRYLPEYRALRAKVDFETLTRTPELACEVTLQPLQRFELDAAILFSDIMTPLQGMGVDLKFEPGPVVAQPIRTGEAQIEALPRAGARTRRTLRAGDDTPGARAGVPRGVPLIGFAGGPFTLLCYLVCGKPSKEFGTARAFLYAQPQAAQRLLTHLADAMAAYLAAQAAAGAQALSHAVRIMGGLYWRRRSLPSSHWPRCAVRRPDCAAPVCPSSITSIRAPRSCRPSPTSTSTSSALTWRSPLSQVRRTLGPGKAVQGNLDPAALFASPPGPEAPRSMRSSWRPARRPDSYRQPRPRHLAGYGS